MNFPKSTLPEVKTKIFNVKRYSSGSYLDSLRKILFMEISLKLVEPWENQSYFFFFFFF